MANPLIRFRSVVKVFGPKGAREVDADKFFVTPKSSSDRETVLQPNEIVTDILVPASVSGMKSATYEVRQKEALDWPLAAGAVALTLDAAKKVKAFVDELAGKAPSRDEPKSLLHLEEKATTPTGTTVPPPEKAASTSQSAETN